MTLIFVSLIIFILSIFLGLSIIFSHSWKILIPTLILTVAPSFIFIPISTSIIISGGILITTLLITIQVKNRLDHYINFEPEHIFSGPIKHIGLLFLLFVSFGFYLNTNAYVQTHEFAIPDKVIELTTELVFPNGQLPTMSLFKGDKHYLAQSIPNLSPEQIEMVRQNPQLLQQFGISPAVFNQYYPQATTPPKNTNSNSSSSPQPETNTKSATNTKPVSKQILNTVLPAAFNVATGNITIKPPAQILREMVRNRLKDAIQPVLPYLAILFGILFLVITYICHFVLSWFITPVIVLLFFILNKTNFIKYKTEHMAVRRLVEEKKAKH